MTIHYLDHSGVAVETERHLLIFDYYTEQPADGALTDGVVTLSQLPEGKRIVAFASHGHHDHYNNVIHSWQRERSDTLIFLGDDIAPTVGAVTVRPYTPVTVEDITVTGLRSTDLGVAFIVELDGVVIYHAGDLNWWHWEGEDERWLAQVARAYKSEIDRMAGLHVDVAFVPVDPRLGGSMKLAAQYFMSVVDCDHLVPIHLWNDYTTGAALVADSASAAFAGKVHPVTHRGQCITV